jgi:hypothetical protein
MSEIVGECIRRVNFEAYLEFFAAYEEARLELDLIINNHLSLQQK